MLVLTDSTYVVCVVIFACYVIWGLNLTIRLVSWVRRKCTGNPIALDDTEANLEAHGTTPRRIGPFFRKCTCPGYILTYLTFLTMLCITKTIETPLAYSDSCTVPA